MQVLRNGEWKEFPRILPKLKDDAIPTIFPNLPSYLTTRKKTTKRLADVEAEALEKAVKESLLERKQYIERVSILSLKDIQQHLESNQGLPKDNCTYVVDEERLTILFVTKGQDCPVLLNSIVIEKSLEVSVYTDKFKIDNNRLPYKTLLVKDINVLDDIMDFVKNQNFEKDESGNFLSVISYLKKSNLYIENDCMKFLIEQMLLCLQVKNNRRYSNHTMVVAASLFVYSPAAYLALKKLNCLCLPHPRNLRKLLARMSLSKFDLMGSVQYLRTRINYLQDHEKLVNLVLDEVYVEPRLHFKGGSVYGSSSNNNDIAKTAQVFMVSSVLSDYKDIVCIVPVNNMSSEYLKTEILCIVTELESIGLQVLSLISDNNLVNRKAFGLLSSDGTLQPFISHPIDSTRKIFIIFVTVHIIKCVRNNWVRKTNEKTFNYPLFDDTNILMQADFKHLELLHDIEKTSVIKYAHLLSYKVLYPSNIDKQSVNLALKLLNEKNIVALKHISCDYPEVFINIEGTLDFLKIFTTFWKIVNVKSAFEGHRFNDVYREPIRGKDCLSVQFLMQMSQWLKKWRQSVPVNQSLTAQTFQSICTTVDAFILLSDYIFTKYKIDYLLLGKFQSDDLESRFGSYRQLSGSNYYISFADVIASERKLRFKDLVLLSAKNVDIQLKSLVPIDDDIDPNVYSNVSFFSELLNISSFEPASIPENVLKILTYIGGYVSKKELYPKSCEQCQSWLLLDKNVDVDCSYSFIKDMDRGKLTLPTDTVMQSVFSVWQTANALLTNNCDDMFFKMHNQLAVLFKLSCIFFDNNNSVVYEEKCLCGINIKLKCESIIMRTCKIILNNIVKAKNDKLVLAKQKQNVKLRKLNA